MRPGLYGWMKEKAEVLELLAFWKPEQQAAHRFRIWRPPSNVLKQDQIILVLTSIPCYTNRERVKEVAERDRRDEVID